MLQILKNLIFTKEFGFNIRYYSFFVLSLVLISMIFHRKLVQITEEYQVYRSLRESYPLSTNNTLNPEFKFNILASLLKDTYKGVWTILSSPSSDTQTQYVTKTGDIDIIFQIIQWNKHLSGFYYNYYILIYEDEYNTHSINIANPFPYSFEEDYPLLQYDNDTKIATFSNFIKSSVSQYNYLSLIQHNYTETNITLTFYPNFNKKHSYLNQLKGIIQMNSTTYNIVLTRMNSSIYQSINKFTSLLSVIGLLQSVLFQYLKCTFEKYPDEALKVYTN